MAEHTQEHPITIPAPEHQGVRWMKPESLSFIAALLGIAAAAICAIPAIGIAGIVPAVLAVTAGITAMQLSTTRPGFAIAGVVLGALAVVVAISMNTYAG